MAMTKKEQEMVEGLKTRLALRWTEPVKPDVPPPSYTDRNGLQLTKGFLFNGYVCEVVPACSSSVHHGRGRDDKTTTQGAVAVYSSKLLALKALRHEVEKELAKKLRAIDKQIETEEAQLKQS